MKFSLIDTAKALGIITAGGLLGACDQAPPTPEPSTFTIPLAPTAADLRALNVGPWALSGEGIAHSGGPTGGDVAQVKAKMNPDFELKKSTEEGPRLAENGKTVDFSFSGVESLYQKSKGVLVELPFVDWAKHQAIEAASKGDGKATVTVRPEMATKGTISWAVQVNGNPPYFAVTDMGGAQVFQLSDFVGNTGSRQAYAKAEQMINAARSEAGLSPLPASWESYATFAVGSTDTKPLMSIASTIPNDGGPTFVANVTIEQDPWGVATKRLNP